MTQIRHIAGIFRLAGIVCMLMVICPAAASAQGRERTSINRGWRFMKGDPPGSQPLAYDTRPSVNAFNDNVVADTRANDMSGALSSDRTLKKWILPSANPFIKDSSKRYRRPEGDPGKDIPFVQNNFDDSAWERIDLPHDWAIRGPFYTGAHPEVSGGMGRLPVQGVGWYRKKLHFTAADRGRIIYLDIDGAMSYAMVWLNGHLVGGWPYGYNSFRLDLTPWLQYDADNQLAIRLDNPNYSSRWYPGAGIYRNVWLTKLHPVHVAQWGTFVHTSQVAASAATVDLAVQLENRSDSDQQVQLVTDLFAPDHPAGPAGKKVGSFARSTVMVPSGKTLQVRDSLVVRNPLLWGPPPLQTPHLYVAVTRLYINGSPVDEYDTRFGIRSFTFDPLKGLLVNGRPVRIQGVNQHHDLGPLGAAFNLRAAERQLQLLREMGCNAIRLAHNPPAPELLDLADRMGFLVMAEIFDCWERGKTPLDFHLIFRDWHEADLRAFIRRDRNHPSIMAWSFGNEVGEQYTGEEGAALARSLHDMAAEEDSTRPSTSAMNYAKPGMPFAAALDLISLNYQGEGIRDAPAYAHLKGIRTPPLYPAFQKEFPGKCIVSSETASALSSRGSFLFPVTDGNSAPTSDSSGGDAGQQVVSAYELYTAQFGSSPDKVFASQDRHPFVAGEFVWSGCDYLGEPTPYYTARSSYSGIIDLAGFRKDRFYLYQSRWLPDVPMAHILPHWNWPGRAGKITPVHVFTSGDEAELFLNGRSLGRKKKAPFAYRLRWDSVRYEPGQLKVVAYRKGARWAGEQVETTGEPFQLKMSADSSPIRADGQSLCFISVRVADRAGRTVPVAHNTVLLSIDGPGEIVATDNGDPASLVSFASKERAAYGGWLLVIVRSRPGQAGTLRVSASSEGLRAARIQIQCK